MAYQEPEWAQAPSSHEWFLLEIKGGVEVNKVPLHTRNCTILGRAADQVHIPLHHESSSRQHARIAFDPQGIPWLRDLGSTHGTTCNKRPLPSLAIGKQETNRQTKGARGIMLFPGDILQFGASTRIFCVEGSPEFERGAYQAKQQQLEQQRIQQQQQQKMEEPAPESLSEPVKPLTKSVTMDAEVPEKHRKTLERLNAMKYKLGNLQTEDDRIRRKGDLTDGQERQLQRNEEREKALEQSIAELEAALYDKLHPEQVAARVPVKQSEQVLEDDEDEFFDRTKRTNKSVVDDEESEASLIKKWKQLQNDTSHRNVAIQQARAKVEKISSLRATLETQGDTEEVFFMQNDLQLAKERMNKLSEEQQLSDQNMLEIEKLLYIVNPKLYVDRNLGYIGEGKPLQPDNQEATPQPPSSKMPMLPPATRLVSSASRIGEHDDISVSMPPPPPKVAGVSSHPLHEKDEEGEQVDCDEPQPEFTMPPPKRKRVVGPAMPLPAPTRASGASSSERPHSSKKAEGTLACLQSMHNVPSRPQGSTGEQASKPEPLAGKANPEAKSITSLALQYDEWRAPEGQDGSGKTKLNAKFAGRY